MCVYVCMCVCVGGGVKGGAEECRVGGREGEVGGGR